MIVSIYMHHALMLTIVTNALLNDVVIHIVTLLKPYTLVLSEMLLRLQNMCKLYVSSTTI